MRKKGFVGFHLAVSCFFGRVYHLLVPLPLWMGLFRCDCPENVINNQWPALPVVVRSSLQETARKRTGQALHSEVCAVTVSLSAYSETVVEWEENTKEDVQWPERTPGKSATNCGSESIL